MWAQDKDFGTVLKTNLTRPGLFKRWIMLSTGQITIQCIVICPADSVIHLLNSWGQKFSSVCGVGYSWMWVSDTAKFAKKNPGKSAVFYWLFLGEVFARNFQWNWPIFLRISPWKSFEIWLFSAKIPRNRPIFQRICPWKSHEILFSFFLRNIGSPAY